MNLQSLGFSEDQIIEAFAENPATQLKPGDTEGEELARIIIRHALGLSVGNELEAYLPPVEALNLKFLKATGEGHLCQASCPDSADDFTFLADGAVPEKKLKGIIADRKDAFCKYVWVASHRRNPYGYTDPDTSTSSVAKFKLTPVDIDVLRSLLPGATNIVNGEAQRE